MNTQDYNDREISRTKQHISKIITEREDIARLHYHLTTDLNWYLQSIEYLLAGHYGYGELLIAQNVLLHHKTANRVAQLAHLANALEYNVDTPHSNRLFKKLPKKLQNTLNDKIQKMIDDYLRENLDNIIG